MSTTTFKEVSYSLLTLLGEIQMGEIGLPDIQRPFVWSNAKVRDLFDSMYRGFPVGSLLFWVNGFSETHRQIGTDSKQKIARLLIVDGQQRLTSLYSVLRGVPVVRSDYRKDQIRIAFCPGEERFEVADAAVQRDPEFIADISKLWDREIGRSRFVREFLKRLRGHREVDESEEERLNEAIDRLYDLQKYPFTVLELSAETDEEQVSQVFVRINSGGTPLNQADFILTLMSVFWDDGRAELERFCRDARQPSAGAASSFNHFIQPDPDQLLRVSIAVGFRRARLQYVYSLLRGKDLETGEFSETGRDEQFAVLRDAQTYVLDLQNWHQFFKALLRAGFRRAEMVTSKVALLYSYAFFLIGKRDFHVDDYALRTVIARWFFMNALTRRYTGSPETVMEGDLARLRAVGGAEGFVSVLDRLIAETLTEDYWSIALPNDLATSSSYSPALFAYHAALSLLDARVLFSKARVSELLDPASHAKKSALERHHLFPKGCLAKLGITAARDTNQIANYALVEWTDNVEISDESPSGYLPRYVKRFAEQELAQMWHWHALPEGWEAMGYLDFLAKRRQLIAQVIRNGFETLLT